MKARKIDTNNMTVGDFIALGEQGVRFEINDGKVRIEKRPLISKFFAVRRTACKIGE